MSNIVQNITAALWGAGYHNINAETVELVLAELQKQQPLPNDEKAEKFPGTQPITVNIGNLSRRDLFALELAKAYIMKGGYKPVSMGAENADFLIKKLAGEE